MSKKYTSEELKGLSKEALIALFLSMQDQLEQLNNSMQLLIEQISIANGKRFGRSLEKMAPYEDQLVLKECFNEAEVTLEGKEVLEPKIEEVCSYKRKKTKCKRDEDLKNIPVKVISHKLTDEQLTQLFGKDNWKELPEEVYKRLTFHPVVFEVEEHHVAVYAGKDNETIVRADRPADLLRNSIVTPSLAAAIMNAKYVNAIPPYRLEQEFKRAEVNISRQVMANWVIRCAERYLSLVWDRLHQDYIDHLSFKQMKHLCSLIKTDVPQAQKAICGCIAQENV